MLWIIDNVTRWNSDDAGTSTNRAGTSTQLNSDIDCAGTSTVDVQLYFVDVQMHLSMFKRFPDVMMIVRVKFSQLIEVKSSTDFVKM